MLRQSGKFEWTEEADTAFQELKAYLTNPPVLVTPEPEEPLLLYIAARPGAMSRILVVERQEEEGQREKIQGPMYFISKVMHGPKERYPTAQKLLYTMFLVSREPRHYFQAHPTVVSTHYPLGEIVKSHDKTGRISKWAVELRQFFGAFISRTPIKS